MTSNQFDRDDANASLSVGKRESQLPRTGHVLPRPSEPMHDTCGNDPYNTSGSFDRSKNWARVRKR